MSRNPTQPIAPAQCRPINFTSQEVLATLAGAKTQVRRIAKFGSVPGDIPNIVVEPYPHEWIAWWTRASEADTLEFSRKAYKPGSGVRCPYGKPGDVLWVRETWQIADPEGDDTLPSDRYGPFAPFVGVEGNRSIRWRTIYRADQGDVEHPRYGKARWKSSAVMPRWASRLKLQITEVRVQRVQDITKADAMAEGIHPLVLQSADDPSAWWESSPGQHQARSARASFGSLWDATHRGPDSWSANPWVFAITYNRLEAGDVR